MINILYRFAETEKVKIINKLMLNYKLSKSESEAGYLSDKSQGLYINDIKEDIYLLFGEYKTYNRIMNKIKQIQYELLEKPKIELIKYNDLTEEKKMKDFFKLSKYTFRKLVFYHRVRM